MGYQLSSFSTWPWLAWCVRWLIRQPWYGTRMDECVILPTTSLSFLLLEKLPWPLQYHDRKVEYLRLRPHATAVGAGRGAGMPNHLHNSPVVADHKQRPKHGALRHPVHRPRPPEAQQQQASDSTVELYHTWPRPSNPPTRTRSSAHQALTACAATAMPTTTAMSLTRYAIDRPGFRLKQCVGMAFFRSASVNGGA